jgi:hypothetical protein
MEREIVSIEPAGGAYGELQVDVAFTYSPAGSTQHEPDGASFREAHPPEVDVLSAVTLGRVEEPDAGAAAWPKFTDVRLLPGWTAADDDALVDALLAVLRERLEYFPDA